MAAKRFLQQPEIQGRNKRMVLALTLIISVLLKEENTTLQFYVMKIDNAGIENKPRRIYIFARKIFPR